MREGRLHPNSPRRWQKRWFVVCAKRLNTKRQQSFYEKAFEECGRHALFGAIIWASEGKWAAFGSLSPMITFFIRKVDYPIKLSTKINF